MKQDFSGRHCDESSISKADLPTFQLILTNIFSIKIWMKLDDISISLGAGSWDMGMKKYLSRTNGLNLIEHSTLKNMPPKVGYKTPTVGANHYCVFHYLCLSCLSTIYYVFPCRNKGRDSGTSLNSREVVLFVPHLRLQVYRLAARHPINLTGDITSFIGSQKNIHRRKLYWLSCTA